MSACRPGEGWGGFRGKHLGVGRPGEASNVDRDGGILRAPLCLRPEHWPLRQRFRADSSRETAVTRSAWAGLSRPLRLRKVMCLVIGLGVLPSDKRTPSGQGKDPRHCTSPELWLARWRQAIVEGQFIYESA